MSKLFSPISVHEKDFECSHQWLSRKRQPFNDKRLYSTFLQLSDQMKHEQKIVIQQIARDTSESERFYRFYGNKKISTEELIKMNCTINTDCISGKDVLCISDSTSFNMKKCEGHVSDFENFGVLNGGETPGFHAHASLVLDADDGYLVGLSDIILWQRSKGKKAENIPKRDKESYKWQLGATNSEAILSQASSINYIFDREADDFELFVHINKELCAEFTIRLKHNRKIKSESGISTVNETLSELPVALVYEVDLPALDHYSWTSGTRKMRKARKAKLELRFAQIEVLAPEGLKTAVSSLKLSIVEVREITENLPEGEEPLHWKLWTSKSIQDSSAAKRVVEHYLMRWNIEQLFRTMKKKGFSQETTELGSVEGILKQTVMTFKAATAVMQLVSARDLEEAPPIEHVFDEHQQKVLNKVNERLEGKTDKLKNPFSFDKLSYAAWVIARLGGWKGYKSQKPPGPMTMKRGLDKFYAMYEAYLLFDTT